VKIIELFFYILSKKREKIDSNPLKDALALALSKIMAAYLYHEVNDRVRALFHSKIRLRDTINRDIRKPFYHESGKAKPGTLFFAYRIVDCKGFPVRKHEIIPAIFLRWKSQSENDPIAWVWMDSGMREVSPYKLLVTDGSFRPAFDYVTNEEYNQKRAEKFKALAKLGGYCE